MVWACDEARENGSSKRCYMKVNVKGKNERKRPKKRWLHTAENDLRAAGACVRDVENRDKRRFVGQR